MDLHFGLFWSAGWPTMLIQQCQIPQANSYVCCVWCHQGLVSVIQQCQIPQASSYVCCVWDHQGLVSVIQQCQIPQANSYLCCVWHHQGLVSVIQQCQIPQASAYLCCVLRPAYWSVSSNTHLSHPCRMPILSVHSTFCLSKLTDTRPFHKYI